MSTSAAVANARSSARVAVDCPASGECVPYGSTRSMGFSNNPMSPKRTCADCRCSKPKGSKMSSRLLPWCGGSQKSILANERDGSAKATASGSISPSDRGRHLDFIEQPELESIDEFSDRSSEPDADWGVWIAPRPHEVEPTVEDLRAAANNNFLLF